MAFANVEVGDVVPNPSLPTADGGERSLVAKSVVSVFVFFDPTADRSLEVVRELAGIRNGLGDRAVHWTGVVSDRFAADTAAAAVAGNDPGLQVATDRADALYGELGVRLYPTVGVVDADGRLATYLPYTKVNFAAAVDAHIRHALGELTDEELAAVVEPAKVSTGGDAAVAARNLRFARMLADAGKPEKALEKARAALELDPDSADARLLVGRILADLGDCEAARESLGRAIELGADPADASEARGGCGEP
jgi:hypothetical protein